MAADETSGVRMVPLDQIPSAMAPMAVITMNMGVTAADATGEAGSAREPNH
jgi:hypothetical protein